MRQYKNNETVEIRWIPAHVGVREREVAYEEVRRARDKRQARIRIPINDFLNTIKEHIKEKWEKEWRMTYNNKLRAIKETTKN